MNKATKTDVKMYLLGEKHCKERNPPPVLAVLFPHITKSPILSLTPLPFFSSEIIMCQPYAPNPN
jgi:hypothetical protein